MLSIKQNAPLLGRGRGGGGSVTRAWMSGFYRRGSGGDGMDDDEGSVVKVDESVANTIKEQLSERVITPLFTNNNVVLPPGKNAYDVIDALVHGVG
nr:hypothetical protein CTI12_AA260450, mitochondrial [Tanacetum cinerariifolium]